MIYQNNLILCILRFRTQLTSVITMSSEEDTVPVVNRAFNDLQDERTKALIAHFEATHLKSPSFLVRVPGRVNLIGEHIDYCGYAVFPMAIEADILMAVDINTTKTLNLTNFERAAYPAFSRDSNAYVIGIPPKWYDYFLCGYRGVTDEVT